MRWQVYEKAVRRLAVEVVKMAGAWLGAFHVSSQRLTCHAFGKGQPRVGTHMCVLAASADHVLVLLVLAAFAMHAGA